MAPGYRTHFSVILFITAFAFELSVSFHVPLVTHHQDPVGDRNFKDGQNMTKAMSSDDCPWCQGRLGVPKKDEMLTDSDIRLIRLELVKAKILSRLNLTEVPRGIKERHRFPSVVMEGKIPGASIDESGIPPSDESTPSSIIVADSKVPCYTAANTPSSCFKFQMDSPSENDIITREAQLWLWKLHFEGDERPQLITVSQIRSTNRSGVQDHLISYYATNVTEGWISINISWRLPESDNTNLVLRISCSNCKGKRTDHPVASSVDHRPFLVINEATSSSENINNRVKRSAGECSDSSQRCCRDSLYVDFEELGWRTWILQPPGFTMYYCRGSCSYVTANSVARARNSYTGLLQRLMLRPNISSSLREALSPCCSAEHKEALSVLWVPPGSVSSARVSRLQDMIVTSCDCFG